MEETPENRLKRLRMRSWRRGIKEMDIILGTFADAELAALDTDTLDVFEAMLNENDQDLYPWFTGLNECPAVYRDLFAEIKAAKRFR